MSYLKTQAFSLIELITALAIAGILLVMGIPAFREWQYQQKLNLLTRQLIKTITYARTQAILYHETIRICPLDFHHYFSSCGNDWDKGWKIENKTTQQVLFIYHPPAGITITWQNLRKENQLILLPEGSAEGSNGSFQYANYRLVINRGGRARLEKS